ncbi:endonuclease/exonuclease/phosphatase family protein [Trifolium medium]|uniref:Endonuclease/exonuclease/phosphatase family protein n=1 Tax=Trifolium medium TaxID=97028 RepID=A0A392P3A1_9FABA|nr:endonuclease/exonuclease/phosphatase family protein [Trifolium medium]
MGAKEWLLMIVMTFNIRGLGGKVKRRRIRELVRDHKVDFLALQETKMETILDDFCQSLWGSADCSWAFVPAVGASGGILSICGFGSGNWCVVGDFNAVKMPEERRGVNIESSLTTEMRGFSGFLRSLRWLIFRYWVVISLGIMLMVDQ